MRSADQQLLQYVKRRVRAGSTHIRVPASLLESASEAARRDVRDLCRINNITLTVVADG
jgi:hypothetical protein